MKAGAQLSLFALFEKAETTPIHGRCVDCGGETKRRNRSQFLYYPRCADCQKIKNTRATLELQRKKRLGLPTTPRGALVTSNCVRCKEPMEYRLNGAPRMYCVPCRTKVQGDKRAAQKLSNDPVDIAIRERDEELKRVRSAARLKDIRSKRFCLHCGSNLPGRSYRYCNAECRRLGTEKRKLEERLKARGLDEWPTKECLECGDEFVARPHSKQERKFCCQGCSRKWALREKTRKRRARLTTLAVVDFTVESVLKRDNWTCQICGVKTPKSVRGTGADNEPHMDHIMPLARGGDHAPSNCRCLCRKCNLDKGALTDKEWRAKKRERRRAAA